MEFVIIIAVIIVCCLILNVNTSYIIFGLAILMCGIFALMAIFFVYSIIKLACSKPKEARFQRFHKVKNSKVQMAYYLVEGEEYPCFFPKEFILEKKLYSQDKIYKVMLNKKSKKVFDKYAITTCVLGLFFCVVISVFMGGLIILMK